MTATPHPSQSNQKLPELHTKTRKRRKDAGHPRWQERDYDVVPWIGEQGLIRFDQLQQLLGRESADLNDWYAVLSESATRNAIDRWEVRHLVNSGAVMPKEPNYYWLSNAGLAFAELSLPHYSPKPSAVPYLLACNQARLHLELLSRIDKQEFGNFEECFWVSERELQSRDPEGLIHHPSGEFWTQTRGTLAIEVAIVSKQQTEQVMRAYAQGQLGN